MIQLNALKGAETRPYVLVCWPDVDVSVAAQSIRRRPAESAVRPRDCSLAVDVIKKTPPRQQQQHKIIAKCAMVRGR